MSDHDDFELTAEELEEERQDAAVRHIQRAYRVRRARQLLRHLIRANYVKIKDPEFELGLVYKNKTTGEIRTEKPKFLGEEDLPDPRDFKAPFGYDPGDLQDFGCAMIVTVSEFKDPKITNLEPSMGAEHVRFENLLTHDFICRYKEENMVSLLNPTLAEFIDGVERLRRMSRPNGFIFLYLCTHVATISGIPEGSICFKDAMWKNKETAARSTLSLTRFCSLLNGIPCTRKTVALSIAHPSNTHSRFSSMILYPPRDFYSIVADRCKCAVLGACNIGTPVRGQLMHTPPLPVKERENEILIALKKSTSATAKKVVGANEEEDPESSDASSSEDDTTKNIVRPSGRVRYRRYRHHEYCPAVVLEHLEELKKIRQLRRERDAVVIKEPHPAWQRNPEHEFIVVTPHPREHRRYYWSKKWERFIKRVRPTLDRWSDSSLERTWLSSDTNRQHGYANDGGSAFVQALVGAFNGGIDYTNEVQDEYSNASVGTVVVSEVFKYIRKDMKTYFKDLNELKRLQIEQSMTFGAANALAASRDMEKNKQVKNTSTENEEKDTEGEDTKPKKNKKKGKQKEEEIAKPVYLKLKPQDPVLFLPMGAEESTKSLSYPLCFRPSAPPPSDKPFAIKVGDTFVLLEWEQATFDGVPVSKYDIYMRNETRIFSDWKLAPGASNVKAGGMYTRFTVNHLPIGVRTEFRIVGFNTVGRSLPSRSSVKLTPGENLQPVGSEHRWRRLAQGGIMAILDHMEYYMKFRHEVLRGFRLAVAFAQKSQGFQRMTAQVRACKISAAIIDTYPDDIFVISGALLLIGYSCFGASRAADPRGLLEIYSIVDKYSLGQKVEKYRFEFESVTIFHQAVYWCVANGVPGVSLHGIRGAEKSTTELFNIFKLNSEEDEKRAMELELLSQEI